MTLTYTKSNFSLQPRNLWLQVLNDYMYDFSHKLLLWILFVKIHSHILMGHVTSKWWSGNKMEGVSFHHLWLMTKWCGHPIVITMIKKWLQVIWYAHQQPYPPPIYLSTHLFMYYLLMYRPTYLASYFLLVIHYITPQQYIWLILYDLSLMTIGWKMPCQTFNDCLSFATCPSQVGPLIVKYFIWLQNYSYTEL
jgi:hypothetical protein